MINPAEQDTKPMASILTFGPSPNEPEVQPAP